MTLEAIKSEIEKLPASERAELTHWIMDHDEAEWDQQIARDFEHGKLDQFIERARRERDTGTIREAP